jgi:hypothetical protein
MDDAALSPLSLTLHAEPVADPARVFAVTARFTNTSEHGIRLLELFDPVPVFFVTALAPIGGGEIDVAGMGKIDAADGSLQYVELASGASFEVALDLAPWIRAPLAPGPHRLAMRYHNGYGADCFHGLLDSAPINVTIGPGGGQLSA